MLDCTLRRVLKTTTRGKSLFSLDPYDCTRSWVANQIFRFRWRESASVFRHATPYISPGKINLVDTHREGDWTLEAVTGHGLQRLQQIACVKERTAINGCIIQYSTVVYTCQYVLADASVRTRARTSRQVCVHVHTDIQSRDTCVLHIHVYVYIDTTERGVLFTARGRYCRQERLSGITRSRARVREMDGRKRPRTTKGDDTLCSTLFSVYFSTSISPIRYRFFVNTVLRVGSIIVWHPQLSLSLFLFLCLCYSLPLPHIFIALDIRVLRFWPLPPFLSSSSRTRCLLPSRDHSSLPSLFILYSASLFWSHSTGSTCSRVHSQ